MSDAFRDTFVGRVLAEMKPHGSYGSWLVDMLYEATQRAGYVILTEQAFERMDRAEDTLIALESAGVDNWEGYDSAMRDVWQSDEDEDEDE